MHQPKKAWITPAIRPLAVLDGFQPEGGMSFEKWSALRQLMAFADATTSKPGKTNA